MLGKRTIVLTLGLVAVLVVGQAAGRAAYRAYILNPELEEAIRYSDLPRIDQLLRRGADPNRRVSRDDLYWLAPDSALAVAAYRDDGNRILEYARCGASVQARNRAGATPLMLAAAQGNIHALRALIQCGAELNARDDSGHTPLMYAAGMGWGHVPIHGKMLYRDPVAIRILLHAGADPNRVDEAGETAMSKAEEARERDFVTTFRAVHAKGLREVLAGTPEPELFYAVRTQNLGMVKRLIRGGARVAVQDRHGMTPLMCAAHQYDGVLIHYLARHAVDVKQSLELRGPEGRTALFQSYIYKYNFRELLAAGADPKTIDANGTNLFQVTGKPEQQLLIQAGAKPPPR